MTWISIIRALLLLAPVVTVAQLVPRQHAFNGTATTPTTTSQGASITTPPPCCWIVIGQFAVGYNSWYTSTAEQVVGMHKNLHPVPPDS